MPGKRPGRESEKVPRGLLDPIEDLEAARRRRRNAKAKAKGDLDLDRIG